ncbi:MAG: hypothetical protein Q4B73_07395 [Lachnospiraceae bacterium]|nr:hypothetical protein [Lachnospiraceae bacterium]
MAFSERFQKMIAAADDTILEKIVTGGFTFDLEVGGEKCGFDRMRDRVLGNGILQTDFLVFPQNDDKRKRVQGVVMTLHSDGLFSGEDLNVTSVSLAGFKRPMMPEIYYAHVASRGGKQIEKDGCRTFLGHTIVVVTKDEGMVDLDAFNFEACEGFMLKLWAGEIKIGIRKND